MHQALAATATTEGAAASLSPQDELRAFRNVVRSLADDAANALCELETWCTDADQLERCYLVRHYLDYMKRLCEGRA
jgi:hypothetical protein